MQNVVFSNFLVQMHFRRHEASMGYLHDTGINVSKSQNPSKRPFQGQTCIRTWYRMGDHKQSQTASFMKGFPFNSCNVHQSQRIKKPNPRTIIAQLDKKKSHKETTPFRPSCNIYIVVNRSISPIFVCGNAFNSCHFQKLRVTASLTFGSQLSSLQPYLNIVHRIQSFLLTPSLHKLTFKSNKSLAE